MEIDINEFYKNNNKRLKIYSYFLNKVVLCSLYYRHTLHHMFVIGITFSS